MSMKSYLPLLMLLGLSLGLSSCLKDKCEATYTYEVYQPVFAKVDEFRKAIETEAPRAMKHTGKIYVYGQYLLVNEIHEGIHIIDNKDPEHPQPVAFIKIPGNVDMAVRNDLLYADNYIDLVTLDISNPQAPHFIGRTEDVFPSYGLYEDLGYLIYYEPTNQTVKIDCNDEVYWNRWGWGLLNTVAYDVSGAPYYIRNEATTAGVSSNTGVGGSMSRFTFAQDHFYVVDNYSLKVFDLENAEHPALANTVNIGWNIETIFPYTDKLFIGSTSGMFIFDASNPTNPTQLAVFAHAQACDPVFVADNKAYVTLRNGTTCQNFTNQLDVIDVTDLINPVLLKSFPMHNPHGLSIVDNTLLLCEGDEGLKLFDASDWAQIGNKQLSHITGFNTFDVIALDNPRIAIVVGSDGLYQYDFSDPSHPRRLSVLSVVQ